MNKVSQFFLVGKSALKDWLSGYIHITYEIKRTYHDNGVVTETKKCTAKPTEIFWMIFFGFIDLIIDLILIGGIASVLALIFNI
jgi:hypothetical protein